MRDYKSGQEELESINSGSNGDKDSSTGTNSHDCHESQIILDTSEQYGKPGYPFPLVLRLRVLQIVCGLTGVVMGAVACIEERTTFNLGIGVPTGLVTVLAAAFGIYFSRGFGGYRPRPSFDEDFDTGLILRILGPAAIAVPICLLWTTACSLHIVLLVLVYSTLTNLFDDTSGDQENDGADVISSNSTLLALGVIFVGLSSITLGALACILRIEWLYDPDWPEIQMGEVSVTGVSGISMVALPTSSSRNRTPTHRALLSSPKHHAVS